MFLSDLKLKWMGRNNAWLVDEPLPFQTDKGDIIIIPEGFKTDGASSPFGMLITPLGGKYVRAAILHDYLYYLLRQKTPHPLFPTRKDADRVFLDAMKEDGVGFTTRNAMWTAVRVFGGIVNSGYFKDFAATKIAREAIKKMLLEDVRPQ